LTNWHCILSAELTKMGSTLSIYQLTTIITSLLAVSKHHIM